MADYVFQDGELDDAPPCPRCGGALIATEVFFNEQGDRCQVGFCPDCPEPEAGEAAFLIPKSARRFQ